jgi:hypothetical protein
MITDPDDTTLASYQAAADSYIEQTTAQAPVLLAFLNRLADLVGHGHVLGLAVVLAGMPPTSNGGASA